MLIEKGRLSNSNSFVIVTKEVVYLTFPDVFHKQVKSRVSEHDFVMRCPVTSGF